MSPCFSTPFNVIAIIQTLECLIPFIALGDLFCRLAWCSSASTVKTTCYKSHRSKMQQALFSDSEVGNPRFDGRHDRLGYPPYLKIHDNSLFWKG